MSLAVLLLDVFQVAPQLFVLVLQVFLGFLLLSMGSALRWLHHPLLEMCLARLAPPSRAAKNLSISLLDSTDADAELGRRPLLIGSVA